MANGVLKIDTSFDTASLEIGVRDFEKTVTEYVKIAAGAIVAISASVLSVENTLKAVDYIKKNLKNISDSLVTHGINIANLAASITALAGPIAIAAAAIAGLALMFTHLWETNEEFRANITASWESIKESIGGIIETIKGIFYGFMQGIADNGTMQSMVDTFVGIWQPIEEIFTVLFEAVASIFAALFELISSFLGKHSEECHCQVKTGQLWQTIIPH